QSNLLTLAQSRRPGTTCTNNRFAMPLGGKDTVRNESGAGGPVSDDFLMIVSGESVRIAGNARRSAMDYACVTMDGDGQHGG
ncbi:MAG: hypothetical protein ACK4GG_08475, partial [Sphingomonas sp.]